MGHQNLRLRPRVSETFPIEFGRHLSPDQCSGGAAKRFMDISLAALTIVMLTPLLVGVALLVRLSDGGPAFFSHDRLGHGGRRFKCWKFRTMTPDAPARLREYLAQNSAAAEEWQRTRKLRNDPRITPLGWYLRTYSIDELPQLFNILLGEMSFVGPRPIEMSEMVRYGPSRRFYLKARPGLTGLWQVNGRNEVSYRRRVAFDRYYVTHWSAKMDVVLIFRTFAVVLSGRGAY